MTTGSTSGPIGGKPVRKQAFGEWLSPSEALAQLKQPAPLLDSTAFKTATVRFGYRIGPLGFLVGTSVLSELLPAPEIYPIPNVHAAIRGYVNLQGSLVPVWNLRTLLGEDTVASSAGASVLVLGRGERRVGMLIDGLPRSLKQLEPVKRSPPPPDALDGYVKDAQVGDGAIWYEFEHEEFFRVQTERIGA